jgi:hypothetical protein
MAIIGIEEEELAYLIQFPQILGDELKQAIAEGYKIKDESLMSILEDEGTIQILEANEDDCCIQCKQCPCNCQEGMMHH